MNGKTPLYLTILGAVLLTTGLAMLQPYSVTSPWSAYTRPAQRFLRAALSGDSLALARQSGSSIPVAWALDAARLHPDSLAVWAHEAKAWSGDRRGDTADILLHTSSPVCSKHPIWMSFVGSGDQVRVLRVSSTCFEPR